MSMERVKPLKLDSSDRKIWFTSDTHFGHQNIIRFCNRPWATAEDMDEALISNWNQVVGENDLVFHLGDFAFAPNWRWQELVSKLNGEIVLILGNHDITRWPGDKTMELFSRVENQLLLKIDGRFVYLNHYPFLCYAGVYRKPDFNTIQLYGHVHSGRNSSGLDSDRLVYTFPEQFDVGVDNNGYTPVSWDTVLQRIKHRRLLMEHDMPIHHLQEHTIPNLAYTE